MNFPSIPRGLRDWLELARWLGKIETWAADTLARLAALDQAPVHQVSENATVDPSWDVVEYTGPGGHILTLPAAARAGTRRSRPLYVVNSGPADITLAAQANELFEGAARQTLRYGTSALLRSNGDAAWRGLGGITGGVLINGPDGTSTQFRYPLMVMVAGVAKLYLELGGFAPHLHSVLSIVTAGTMTIGSTADGALTFSGATAGIAAAKLKICSGGPSQEWSYGGAATTGRGAAIADATDLATAISQLNLLLAFHRTKGEIAT